MDFTEARERDRHRHAGSGVRGAGSLLGAERSGHLAGRRLRVSLTLLEEAVAAAGESRKSSARSGPVIVESRSTLIYRRRYVMDEIERVDLYHRA